MNAHKQTAARFLAMAFAIVLLVISATTSFAFFFNHFYIIPPSLLGETVGQLISGIVGVLLFDAATSIWLVIYLQDARTPEQRAISLVLAGFTFLGAAAASVAHLALSATGTMALDIETLDTISMIALVCVILGVIANFGGSLMYSRFSHENKIAVRESDRSDAIQQAEDEQARLLDGLIAQGVKEQITAVAPALAKEQASRLVEAFRSREMAKYAGTGQPGETAVPRRFYHLDQENGRQMWFGTEKEARQSAAQLSTVWDDNVVVFREDGTKIAEYGGPSGGVDLMQVFGQPQPRQEAQHPTRPTPAPRQAQAHGYYVQIEDLTEESGWYTVNKRPFATLDQADAEIDRHIGTRRRIVDQNGNHVLRNRETPVTRPTPAPRQAQANGHNAAGLNYPER